MWHEQQFGNVAALPVWEKAHSRPPLSYPPQLLVIVRRDRGHLAGQWTWQIPL